MVSIIPLGSIYWDDEMPGYLDLMKLSEGEQNLIWQLFAIRFRIWDDERLQPEDRSLWEYAGSEAPDWALFRRLTLSADDRKGQRRRRERSGEGVRGVLWRADQVRLTDKGRGLHSSLRPLI
jgi:hypothetical protein